jgi:tetratricopeptide (TPR) repeat protein
VRIQALKLNSETRRRVNRPISASSRWYAALWFCLGIFPCAAVQGGLIYGQSGQQTVSGENHGNAKDELQAGTSLTREGKLPDAIPHLLAAQAAGADAYATGVNLGICYIGTGRYKEAISALEGLHSADRDTAAVDNLLAQAYLGDRQPRRAWDAFITASALTPDDEKLYAYMADACTDQRDFEMGLHAIDVGLRHLPDSARLHYERGLFLAQLDRLEQARPEFDRAAQLAHDSYIATLALVQRDLYDGDIPTARHRLLAAIGGGHRDYQTLSLLGTVLMHAGAAPGDPEFAQAQAALEESARTNPEYSATQIALGRIYVLEERFSEAVEHLEIGRRLEPRNPAVYANLARAYHHMGDQQKVREMQEKLAKLLAEQDSNRRATDTSVR